MENQDKISSMFCIKMYYIVTWKGYPGNDSWMLHIMHFEVKEIGKS